MAIYTATQTGNWSNTLTWGGAGYPVAGDTAIINAAWVVTVNGTQSALKIQTSSTGYFLLIAGSNLTCSETNTPGGIVTLSSTPSLQFQSVSGDATFNGSVSDIANFFSPGTYAIQNSSTSPAILTLNGNYGISTTLLAANPRTCINHVGTGATHIVGRSTGNAFDGNVLSYGGTTVATGGGALYVGAGTVRITGVVTGGNLTGTSTILQNGGIITLKKSSTVTANSSINGNTGYGLYTTGGTISIDGNITGGSGQPAIYTSPASSTPISIYSTTGTSYITASSTNPAIYASAVGNDSAFATQSIVSIDPNVVISNTGSGIMAIVTFRLKMEALGTSWLFGTTPTAGTATWQVQAGSIVDYPAPADVRGGFSYGSPVQTGTCVIPAASSVLQGVLVDATIGSLITTPSTLWGQTISPLPTTFTAGSIGERLKNVTTESTQGAQVSAFTV